MHGSGLGWTQHDSLVAEHIRASSQSSKRIVVYVQAEAVEAQEDTHPVEMNDHSILVAQHTSYQSLGTKVPIEHQCHGCR